MNYFFFSGLTNFVTSLLLGLLVLIKGKKTERNLTFVGFCFCVSGWSIFYALWHHSNDTQAMLFFCRTMMLPAFFIPTFFFHYICCLVGNEKKYKVLIYSAHSVSCVLLVLSLLNPIWAISKMELMVSGMYWPKEGILMRIGIFIFGVCFIKSLYDLMVSYKTATGNFKEQLKYSFVAVGIGFGGGSMNYWPNLGLMIRPYGNILVAVYLIIVTHTILKYRLIDLDLIWRYGISYVFYVVATSSVFVVLAFLLKEWFWTTLLLFPVAVFVAPYLYRWLISLLRPVLMKDRYGYWKDMEKLLVSQEGSYTSSQLADNLVKGIYQSIPIESLSFYMFRSDKNEFHPLTQIGNDALGDWIFPWIKLGKEDDLIGLLSAYGKYVLNEDLLNEKSEGQWVGALKTMKKVSAELCFPLFVEDRLMAVLFVGHKKDKGVFHSEDINRLQDIVKAAERNLAHAIFMENRSVYSQKLAHDMKNLIQKGVSPTFYLMNQADTAEKRKAQMASLGHQVRFLESAMDQFFNMNIIFTKILSNSYELKAVDLKSIIEESKFLMQSVYESKKIEIRFEVPELPKVLANAVDLRKVFHNLLDNALKFTEEGFVEIRVELVEEGEILIMFKDTGSGMNKIKLDHIWDPSLEIDEQDPGHGTGLGLTIIRDIIKAHKGKIWVESEESKGTTFYFTLQVYRGVG